ncbi:MAG: metallophosphoesterase family protein [bacterium]
MRMFFYLILPLFFIFPFLNTPVLRGDSFVSMHGYPQVELLLPDYQKHTQTAIVENPFITDILYPVVGFPALVSSDDPSLFLVIRSDSGVDFEYIKITRNVAGETKTFADILPESAEICGENLYCVRCHIPVILSSMSYDLSVKLKNSHVQISKNSVFFPEKSEDTKFYVLADPQIEDLQSKRAGKMNYNAGEYPFKSDSFLTFDRQRGIIKSTISQINSGDAHFVSAVGDLVFGINYQREYEDIMNLIVNMEVPLFAVPGNHDGYAKFTEQNDFFTPLEWDGLQYWTKFFGPLNYAFSFNDSVFIMLNTYEGTTERRAAGEPLGLGDNAAVPVTNWGGFLTQPSLDWIQFIINNHSVSALFSHMTPLGQNASGKYHRHKKFPKESIIGVRDHQEWNYESAVYDTNTVDSIFNETPVFNTGTRLVSMLNDETPPPLYFSGHTHFDRVYEFESGEELIKDSGVYALDDMKFIMTTTVSANGESYWGIRKVSLLSNGDTEYQYMCDKDISCLPEDEDNPGFQSIPAGNIWVEYEWEGVSGKTSSIFTGGDGFSENVSAEAVSYLPTDENLTLRFIMPAKKGGYRIDNENFSIRDVSVSKNLDTALIIVKGSISAASTPEAFLNRDFSKKSISINVTPSNEICPEPELNFPEYITSDQPIEAEVKNKKDFHSLIWIREELTVASGGEVSLKFDDYKSTERINVVALCSSSAFSESSFSVNVFPPEESYADKIKNPHNKLESDHILDYSETEKNETEEHPAMSKSSDGCSILFF